MSDLAQQIESAKQASCWFCDKPRSQVKKLVSGRHGAYICDECVELCHDITCGGCQREDPSAEIAP